MKTVTISVSSMDETKQRFLSAFKGKPQGAHISFPTVELLWKVLAPNRMALVRALTGAGVVSIREAARRVNRDVRAVHSDVTVLINAGLLNRTEDCAPQKSTPRDFKGIHRRSRNSWHQRILVVQATKHRFRAYGNALPPADDGSLMVSRSSLQYSAGPAR